MDDEIIRLAQNIKDNDYPLIKIRSLIENLLNERLPHQVIYDHIPTRDLVWYEQGKEKIQQVYEAAQQCSDCECCQKILEILKPEPWA